jgi:hypothetical protein
MTSVPDLLEQMTWAINEGGPLVGGKQEVFEFLSNVGRVIFAGPSRTNPAKPPTGPYAPDLLPMIQQLSWATATASAFGNTSVSYFLQTVAWYLTGTGPKLNTPPYPQPTQPPLPPALQSLPVSDIPDLYQIAYWLINEGSSGNQKARAFIEAIGYYLFHQNVRTSPWIYRYPKQPG